MSGFTKRAQVYKWETDDIKIRIYCPENYDSTNSAYWIRDSTDRDRPREIGRIYQEYERKIGSYRCPAEVTYSGQDMSYWVKYREDLFNDYKQVALNGIRVEWIRLIKNCKNILTSYEYDMFEEFKKVYPNMANYFNFKENDITWDIAGSGDNNMMIFTDCTIKCVLSQEAVNKKNEKIQKQNEISRKYQEEQKLLLYKKEFECARLFDEIDKNKLKSSELYVEYKKITEMKDKDVRLQISIDRISGCHYGRNHNFINYFTDDKKKYINGLIEVVKNPTPVNEGQSNATQVVSQVKPNKEQDTIENNIVMTVCEVKEKVIHRADVCDTSVKKTKKELQKEKDIMRVLNIFTNKNMKKKYFDSGICKVVLNTPLYDPINEYSKNVNGFWEQHTLGVYLNMLYNKELSEFCLDDKKYYEFMSKSTLIPL